VPARLSKIKPSDLVADSLKGFTCVAKAGFQLPSDDPDKDKFWELMMKADNMSARQFLRS
jgi:hypothetical protein